ncbi:MAG: hypothetical protein KJ676_04550 [Alphaproteobacteria bacterium]|nr:hypothetical protein [Alphaproteobacteria bacterium]MBU1527116.1 hypothetical protein [Alphaproteobacteria bacterium]MBU2116072.1 hypothetical protein [Alphaproteobacteria bacterium]MBU2350688.1 hypothetical protein [Alphaproteobacteria bacterium]MBU2383305.1 hypothetical protein [Alphaproteobacteria bacterium]
MAAEKTRTDLRIVGDAEIYDLMRKPQNTAERIARLQMEARALALEEVEGLAHALKTAAEAADRIARGGDAYPVGARELAARLASDLPARAETIRAIAAKTL